MKTFSDRLKQARKLRGYTQLALARRARLSQSAIGSYESGQRQSSRSLRKLAAALNIEPEWLETGKGPMEASPDNVTSKLSYGIAEPTLHPGTKKTAQNAYWPYPNIAPKLYDTLTSADKLKLEALTQAFIQTCHAQYGAFRTKLRRGS